MSDFVRLENLFFGALGKTEPEERQRFLDAECGQDVGLREQVERLIAGQVAAGSFLEKPAAPEATQAYARNDASKESEPVGSQVGPYKLLQKLGEGGMGTVWVAEQEKPVKRRVALKLIKAGMDSAQVIRRFEAERQALALMDHTNIAKVLDAGTTADGRPYFVMELVKGVPITKYCDEVHASIKNRLELYVQVCSAVQHAHQKGIIHRDIKPSNILVAMQDGKPVPKVIDFGVAKALHSKLADKTMYTEIGQIIGTLEYMAPEQAELSAMDIDTRADIYALGVLLYELLTGSTPITRERMKSAAFAEVIRLIKEEEPPKPSTRLTQSKESLANLAALRKTDPKHLSSELKGELDWVVLKALEKDRTCRYETANGLARDIQRYLADELVEARPPSAGYRLRKFVRRNKGQVIAASLVLFALLAGISGTTIGLFEAKKQEQLAKEATVEERKARDREADRAEGERLAKLDAQEKEKLADTARKKAIDMAAQSEAISDFLQLDLLRQADVNAQADRKYAPDRDLTIRVALDRAAEKVGSKFSNRPHVEIAIRQIIGITYTSLAEFDKAVIHLRRASELSHIYFGSNDKKTHTMDHFLGAALLQAGRNTEAIPILERTLTASEQLLGAEHPETLMSRSELALIYKKIGDLKRAIPLYERTLRSAEKNESLGPHHEDTLVYANGLAIAYLEAQRFEEAIALAVRVLEGRRKILGESHPLTEQARSNLGGFYVTMNRNDLARPLLEQSFTAKVKAHGPDHIETLITQAHLARCLGDLGETAAAMKHLETILAVKTSNTDRPFLLGTRIDLAILHRKAGNPELGVPILRDALEQAVAVFGTQSSQYRSCTHHLAVTLQQLQKFDESEQLFRKLVEVSRAKAGPKSLAYGTELAYLGNILLSQRKWAEAESVLAESRALFLQAAPERWFQFQIQSAYAGALLGQKKYAEAEPLLLAAYDGMKLRYGKTPEFDATRLAIQTRLFEALDRLIQLYTATNKPEEVKKWQSEKERISKTPEKK